ncbi:MAG: two-component regulator propeller domain-containing protein [Ferruginibacter sp.]
MGGYLSAITPWKNINNRYRLLFPLLFLFINTHAQPASYNFTHITTSDGLSNSVVRALTQDKYGYIWIGTLNGLCRYNGYTVETFVHQEKEPYSLPDNFVQGLLCDGDKNIWVSFQNGLYRFDYPTSHFILQAATKGIQIRKIMETGHDTIVCAAAKGIAFFHPSTGSFTYASADAVENAALLKRPVNDIFAAKNEWLYLATDTGLVIYQPLKKKVTLIDLKPIRGQRTDKVTIDSHGTIWISYGGNGESILKTDPLFTKFELLPNFLLAETNVPNNHVSYFFNDSHNRLWIGTSGTGLCLYDTSNNKFIRFGKNPLQPSSISSSNLNSIYQDKQGFIWLGTEGYGVNYFHPDDNLFHSILPDYNQQLNFPDNWARAVTQDNKGDLWLGNVSGLSVYKTSLGSFRYWRNENDRPTQLYSNSVRCLLHDDHDCIWIGTAQGLNRYNPAKDHMDFFGVKDSMPYSFFWALIQDHEKNIWIGSREGLFQYNYTTNTFRNFEQVAAMATYCHYNFLSLFEDSHKRMWMGTYKNGLIMYDPQSGIAKHWMKNESDSSFINNNIRSITEDKNGFIWVASNEGITSYDPATEKFKNYREDEGLKTVNASELMVDEKNRLWIGTGKGLFMLDSSRHSFRSFSLKDGLPSLEFNEQVAFKTLSGDFVYPSLKGFLVFSPLDYKERKPDVDVYISAFKVFNQDYTISTNPEELKALRLKYDENFFTLELTGFNYHNPQEIWYAYKLEPFNKEWIYTKERQINYTNVPGGDYVFHFKASADNTNWNGSDNTMSIHIGTVFYKTKWFWALAGLLIAAMLYAIYRYRIAQKERIYSLQNKSQALEKEKAIVQYESLKQQLNPHFLFNSLTSLRSLIRIDKQNAADFLDKMSLNYRYILKSSEHELVPLKDELEFARGYCDMQQTRFGEGLQVNIMVPEESLYKKIVPVTIQNLIENAIKHNLIDSDTPLIIEITEQDNYLVVSNNLQVKDFVDTSNKYGLKHLQFLYLHLDSRPVLITKDEKYFTVKIPLI